MNKYEQYKPSGVEWLGEVPEHWGICRLKNTCTIYNGATPSSANPDYWDGEIIWVTPKDINNQKFIATSERKITEEGFQNCGTNIVPKGSVILTTRAPIGKVAVAEQELCTNQGCKSLVINEKIKSHFLYYLLVSSNERLNTLGTGTTFMELGAAALGSIKIALPPIEEQTTIAAYLDERTAYIDRLIAKQQALSEKLSEKRTALITEAVCGRVKISPSPSLQKRGTSPSENNAQSSKHHETAPLFSKEGLGEICFKDSGIQWLGKIPEHWEAKRLKFAISHNDDVLSEQTDLDEEILYVDISSVSLTDGIKNKELMTFENAPSRARRIVKSGDVLVSTVRTYLKAIAQVENAEPNLIASTGFAVLRSKCGLNPKFLGYYIQSEGVVGAIVANSVGVSYPAINASDLVRLPICMPPETEQTAITTYLDTETAKIDRLQAKIGESVERLKEYRAALITQVVTGKVKV